MSKNEIANIDNIHESQVPSIIRDQFNKLSALRENVEEASKKAEQAQASARLAKNKSAGFFQKKEAIEALQGAAIDLADAQTSAAQAQEVSFEYQQKLGEVAKYLFGLGVTNIAMNRSVVRELEMKLKGASEEELDEFARQEIIGVVRQLKAQQDIMKKQGELTEQVKEHEERLSLCEKKEIEYDCKLKEQEEHEKKQNDLLLKCTRKDKVQDDLIANNKNKIDEHDCLFVEKAKKDKEQDEEIARQVAKDEELGGRIDKCEEKDRIQDEEISCCVAKDEELERRIGKVEAKDRDQDKEIARQAAKDEELERRIDKAEEKGRNQDKKMTRQVVKNEELGERLYKCEEKNRNQDEEIIRRVAKDEELSKLINELVQSNIEKENQIRELKTICEDLSSKMEINSNHVDSVENQLIAKINEKASEKENIISYIIGITALIAAIVQMFIL